MKEDFAPALKLDLKLESSQAKAVKMRLAVIVILTTFELLPKSTLKTLKTKIQNIVSLSKLVKLLEVFNPQKCTDF